VVGDPRRRGLRGLDKPGDPLIPTACGQRLRQPEASSPHSSQHWFLQEQREEVSSMSDLLSVVERALESNILLAEDYLSRNPVGDRGEATNAPPAAGGAL
jgi:hypothetical protein